MNECLYIVYTKYKASFIKIKKPYFQCGHTMNDCFYIVNIKGVNIVFESRQVHAGLVFQNLVFFG